MFSKDLRRGGERGDFRTGGAAPAEGGRHPAGEKLQQTKYNDSVVTNLQTN